MIAPKRVMGVCDDPPGEFCTKLRQKTKKMTGLPLALQLVAYECIPQLLARLGSNDDLKIIDCESLPQHTRLNLVDVLEAEHHSELTVQPMMEIGPDKPDGWGEWDDEIDDRRDLYDHKKRKAANKRKRQAGSLRTNVGGGGHVLKQRRVSTYFRRPTLVDDDKYDELVARFDALEKVVVWMKKRVKEKKKKSAGAAEVEEHRDKTESPIVKDVGEDVSVDVDDVGIGNEKLPAESEDVEAEEKEDSEDSVSEDVESEDEEEEEDGECSGGEDVEAEDVDDSVCEDEEDDEQDKGSRATDVEME
ncbi:hypothetical protein HID58_070120 [Brassica napus]|uniref:Uncharacterized protein n=1 Tax=Brassica napus TaxID=3708 RepID=A0ABQ7YXX9_BRANA|nr:hypothetical protein HID58_070120 [Brassica napus]